MMRVILAFLVTVFYLYGYVAEISALVGKAEIKRNNLTFSAKVGEQINVKDKITTYKNTKVQLIFKDDTVITIGENSEFKVEEFVNGNEPEAKFNLTRGVIRTLTGEIGKIAPRHFNVETTNALIGVRGTEFYVKTASDFTEVGVTYGKVELIGLVDKVSKLVKAGEMAIYYPKTDTVKKEKLKLSDFELIKQNDTVDTQTQEITQTETKAVTDENSVKNESTVANDATAVNNTETGNAEENDNTATNDETAEETTQEDTQETTGDVVVHKFTPVTSSWCGDGLPEHNIRVDGYYEEIGLLGYKTDSISICGTADQGSEITIYVNGKEITSFTSDGYWSYAIPLDVGANNVQVVVKNDNGTDEYDGVIYNLSDDDYNAYIDAISHNDPSVISSIFNKDYETKYSDGIVTAGYVLDDDGNYEVPWIVGYITDSQYVQDNIVEGADTRYEGVIKALSEDGELDGKIFLEFKGENSEGGYEGVSGYFDFESIGFSGQLNGTFDAYRFDGKAYDDNDNEIGVFGGHFYGDEADEVGGRILLNNNGQDINGVFVGDKE